VKFLLELSKMNSLLLLPAVDIAHGQSVRLVKGDLASETIYGEPEAQAQNLVDAGASWIHLVDLDQAYGVGTNLPLLTQVVKNINTNFQISGGIKDSQTLLSAVTTGATRFNLSTAALLDLPWVESAVAEYGNTLTIGLDIQADLLVARGTK
jgi:phosphoribosylformimino-5-aminoimidazole carboxamide ribonucleotide (ProFAR) isomerase